VNGPGLVGGGMDRIVLEGKGVAGKCLEVLTMRGGQFGKLVLSNAKNYNFHIGVVADGDIYSSEPRSCQHNVFEQILSRSWATAAENAVGLLIDGDNLQNSSFNLFGEVFTIHKNGHAIVWGSSDTNVIQ